MKPRRARQLELGGGPVPMVCTCGKTAAIVLQGAREGFFKGVFRVCAGCYRQLRVILGRETEREAS